MRFHTKFLAYLLSGGGAIAVNAISIPILTRLLDPESYGLVVFAMSLLALLLPLISCSNELYLPSVAARSTPEEYRRRAGALSTVSIGLCALCAFVLFVFSVCVGQLPMLVLFVPLIALIQAYKKGGLALLAKHGRAFYHSIVTITSLVVVLLVTIGLLVIKPSAELRLVGIIVGEAIACLALLKLIEVPSLSIGPYWKEIAKFSLPLIASAFPAWMINEYGKVYISNNWGMSTLAFYGVAFQIGYVYMQFNRALVNALTSRVYENIQICTALMPNLLLAFLQAFAALVFVTFLDKVGIIFIPSEYSASLSIVRVVLLGFVFQSFTVLCNFYCSFYSRNILRFSALTSAGLVNVALLFFFGEGGFHSVAVAFAFSMFIYLACLALIVGLDNADRVNA